jgi:Fe-S-cluster containining protein
MREFTGGPAMAEDPWYADGLRFECTRCGKCCTGEPGYVWVNEEEVRAIAAALGEPADEVRSRHTRAAQGGRTLREKADGDCVFFERGVGCTVYEVRPRQCQTWPFWESNVETPADWERTRQICPGSGRGELVPAEEITRRLKVIRL